MAAKEGSADGKKYLFVTEHSHYDARPNTPLMLEVLRETGTMYVTKEFFPANLRDLAPASLRKKEVRWAKSTGLRSGDNDEHPRFRVKKILNGLDHEAARNAILVTA